MKKVFISLLSSSFLFFMSCEGPEGPVGPQGSKGDTGAVGQTGATGLSGKDGTNGTNGVDGKIEAKATPWLSLDFEGGKTFINTYKYNGVDDYYTSVNLQLKDKTQSFLTKEVIDKGIIITYYKVNSLIYDETESAYSLEERITGGTLTGSGYTSFKIEGRTTDKYEDFANCQLFNSEIAENYWNPIFSMSTPYSQIYTNNQYVYSTRAPELMSKTATFYRELAKKNAPKIRLVVIPLSASGRLKSIDYTNYTLVMKTFGLE